MNYAQSFRAIVRDVHDPQRSGRVRVECPEVLGIGEHNWSNWAPTKLPPYYFSALYEGMPCWVSFRGDDPTYPVFEGMVPRANGEGVSELWRQWSEGPYREQLKDATEHAADPWDDADHKRTPGHQHPPYWNPYQHAFHYPQGARWGTNEEPGEQGTFWVDRVGQGFRTLGDPSNPKDPHEETRQGGVYAARELDAGATVRTDEGWRSLFELFATHKQRLVFRVQDDDGDEEVSLEGRNDRDTEGGQLLLSNLLGRTELRRYVPGKEFIFEQVLKSTDPNVAHARLADWHGNEIKIDSAPGSRRVQVRTAGGEQTIWDDLTGGIRSKDRFGNSAEMGPDGIREKAVVNFEAEGAVNALVKGGVEAKLDGGVMAIVAAGLEAKIDAPLVKLGKAPGPGIAYQGSMVATAMGPAFVTLASLTCSVTP